MNKEVLQNRHLGQILAQLTCSPIFQWCSPIRRSAVQPHVCSGLPAPESPRHRFGSPWDTGGHRLNHLCMRGPAHIRDCE